MKRSSLVAFILGLVLLLGACSSASGETSSTTSTTRASKPNASLDQGDAVSITAKGFEPRWLIAVLGQKVTFTNTTRTDQQIVFDNARDASGANIASPVIPPDGTWVWNADSFASFAYHSPNLPDVDGRIQVTPPAEP